MATVANLNVSISASTSKFQSGLASAGSSLTAFAAQFAVINKVVDIAFNALGRAASGLVSYVQDAMRAVDATAKVSDRLGIATEELIRLRHAAELAGGGGEQIDMALQKMNATIGNAVFGSKSAIEAFTQIGLSVNQVAAMSPEQAFRAIADQINKLPSPAARAAAAMDIFGKSGAELINVLALGSEGLKQAGEDADKLGLSLNRVDAAKVEAANDAITRVGSAISGVANVLAVQLSPFIEEAANRITAFATSGEGAGAAVSTAFGWILRTVAQLSDYVNLLGAVFYSVRGIATTAIAGMLEPLALLARGIAKIISLVDSDLANSITSFFDEMGSGLEIEAKKAFDTAADMFESFRRGDNAKAVDEFLKGVQTRADAAATAVASVAKAQSQVDVGAVTALADMNAPAEKEKKTKERDFGGSFRAVDERLISVEGLRRQTREVQEVKSPQIEKSNTLLQKILDQGADRTAVFA